MCVFCLLVIVGLLVNIWFLICVSLLNNVFVWVSNLDGLVLFVWVIWIFISNCKILNGKCILVISICCLSICYCVVVVVKLLVSYVSCLLFNRVWVGELIVVIKLVCFWLLVKLKFV